MSILNVTNQFNIQDRITLEKAAHTGRVSVLLAGVSRELLTLMLMAGVTSTLTALKGVIVKPVVIFTVKRKKNRYLFLSMG